jgi:replicative DNA helicase
MAKKQAFEKDFLIRALITKALQERNLPEVKYEEFFLGEYVRLFKKLNDRKADLPSVKYVVEKYDFQEEETELTQSDIMAELDVYFIKEKTTKIIEQMLKDSKHPDMSQIEVLDRITKEFNLVRGVVTKAYTIDLQTDVDKCVDEYIRIGEDGIAFPTGFDDIDGKCPLRGGYLVGVCGGTGGGKTLSMIKMQAEAIKAGYSSMYFSLEMGLTEMTNRLLAALGKHKFRDMFYNRIPAEEYRKALQDIATVQTHIITRQSEAKIDLATIERYVAEYKPKVIFIDYLTLIDADTSWNAEESVTKVLKRIALQNHCLVVFGCQADTDAVKSGEIPGLTSVRGNKSFPYDCDVFIGLASKRYETDEDRMKISYAVRKSRNGGFPEWQMRVNPNIGHWEVSTGEAF